VIEVPELTPHDLRHGVAMEIYGEHGDLGEGPGAAWPSAHRHDANLREHPSDQLKRSVEFLEAKASRMLEV
jgi:hypothetical protein